MENVSAGPDHQFLPKLVPPAEDDVRLGNNIQRGGKAIETEIDEAEAETQPLEQ